MFDKLRPKALLPHRAPFLFLEKIVALEPGHSAKALHYITEENGLFPDVLIIEALAQTGACALLAKKELQGKTAYFGGIKQATFSGKVATGDLLELSVTLAKLKQNIGLGRGVAKVNDQVVCQAELTFILG